jgi:hypothetical protein
MNETPTCIYSLSGTTKLAIQGRPLPFQITDEVPLGFHANLPGTFTIGLNDYDGIFQQQNIYLKDNHTNQIYDLKEEEYTFISNAGSFENRFILLYQNSSVLNTSSSVFDANSIILYQPNQDLIIHSGSIVMKRVRVFDSRGRLLIEKDAIHSSLTAINIQNTTSILIFEITSQEGKIVFKKYIKLNNY